MKKIEIFTTENGSLAFYVYLVMKSTSVGNSPIPIITYSSEERAQRFCDISNDHKEDDEFYFVACEMAFL